MKILLALLLMTLTSCSGLLYYPTDYRYVDVQILKYQPQEVFFHENKDKHERLMGWYFKGARKVKGAPRALFVFFHGNGQNMSSHFSSLFWVLNEGYDFFIFDYPGYGGSWGKPTPKSTAESGLMAIEYARQQWPKVPLVVFGQSLGGAVSLRSVLDLKDRSRICAQVVESTFDSYKKVGRAAMSSSWMTWLFQPLAYVLLSDEYAPTGKIEQISPIPLLVVHRKEDSTVPFYLGQQIFEQAKEPKRFLELPGAGHIDAFTGAGALQNRQTLLSFVNDSIKNCPN